MPFSEKAIQASFFNYFSTNFTETLNIEYDEEPFDLEGKTEAVEVDAVQFNSIPRRKGGKEFQKILIVVHCWENVAANLYRARELADAVVAALNQKFFDVQDFDASGDPVVGGCNLFEADVIDQTREGHEQDQSTWQHHVVTLLGQAQET